MTRFEECLSFVLAREGGYSADEYDRGGSTNKGITQRTYDDWCDEHYLSRRSVAEINDNEVRAIYRDEYWKACLCDETPAPLDLWLFDSAVQHGPGMAVRLMQRALGVIDTGYYGPRTRAAIRKAVDEGTLEAALEKCMDARRDYYDAIIARDASQERFRRGWENRLAALESAVFNNIA